ncbi:UDP-galactopyranose mutase [Parabacteroides segnis]|jgi:UDP-galactopyranose mutase|uniref:UDP-galactopyranose mutase n=1 Tax=Parabacteroides segnis TaxID=2763058 RepID=A0ABR7E4W3_9BACT|nr:MULTISPECIES: UDP-galactopyranose mutase [Parabacteroides]MBC5644797.1 UDP-galactopyranose mutase [Parabacteroides segnis]MCM0714501.1 UDP-galactopyranose mutase [Parabacteroides sp. TA-V-105]
MYDFFIVGSGLFGATMAYTLKNRGYKCLVIDKRSHIGGNVYTENMNGINVHKYGAHIFHTNNKRVWDFVNSFVEFNRYTNSPIANYKGRLFNLPFNMNTFYQMWGVTTPEEAATKIEHQRNEFGVENPQNLEEQAISLIGKDIYHTLIKDYTEKQWGRKCTELPAFIIQRLPVRFTFDNNYFNDTYQGIPIGGYTKMVERMLESIEVRLNTDYFENRKYFDSIADKIIYTSEIDRYFDYCYGHLEYRTVSFETNLLEGVSNYQGNAVVNYTDAETPYTRIIEHKHFEFGQQPDTVISQEYSKEWRPGDEPYYPVNDDHNGKLYAKYKALADAQTKVLFGGRLAEYKYYDMHQVIEKALVLAEKIINTH